MHVGATHAQRGDVCRGDERSRGFVHGDPNRHARAEQIADTRDDAGDYADGACYANNSADAATDDATRDGSSS